MLDGLEFDIVFFSLSAFVYCIYHVLLGIRVYKKPIGTVIGRNHQFRRQWTQIMIDGKKDILAVQTLRNMVMSSTLMASTSITLVVLIINVLVSSSLTTVLDKIRIIGAHNQDILIYKAFVLILLYLFSFLNFATSIRYITHLAFLVNVAPFYEECSKDYCYSTLKRSSNHFTFGMRTFYFSLPIIMWFFDPIFLLIGTVVIVYWLYIGDLSDLALLPKRKKSSPKSKNSFEDDNSIQLDSNLPIPSSKSKDLPV
eukprot:gene7474-9182_t